MTYRAVKQYSDRGSLKDLVQIKTEDLDPPTSYELRLKALYERSLLCRDSSLSDAAGFIVMSGSGDRSGYPVNIYRHREYVKSLSAKLAGKIETMTQELLSYFIPTEELPIEMKASQARQKSSLQTILSAECFLIKVASTNTSTSIHRSFRRVS